MKRKWFKIFSLVLTILVALSPMMAASAQGNEATDLLKRVLKAQALDVPVTVVGHEVSLSPLGIGEEEVPYTLSAAMRFEYDENAKKPLSPEEYEKVKNEIVDFELVFPRWFLKERPSW